MAQMSQTEIERLEQQVSELLKRLHEARRDPELVEVPNYSFQTADGETRLSELFGNHVRLFAIHNMGQGCRYCMLWADGFNGILPHLESAMSVVLLSKDPPDVQRRFAGSRGWRFRLVSHAGSDYLREQNVSPQWENCPGAVVYQKKDGKIFRRAKCVFGPGDVYCSMWNILALGGFGEEDWVPQYRYWQRPDKLDDGGKGVVD